MRHVASSPATAATTPNSAPAEIAPTAAIESGAARQQAIANAAIVGTARRSRQAERSALN